MSFIAIVALIAGPIERRRDESWERAERVPPTASAFAPDSLTAEQILRCWNLAPMFGHRDIA
jgi:hypothetical protein